MSSRSFTELSLFDLGWVGMAWGERKDYFSFPSPPPILLTYHGSTSLVKISFSPQLSSASKIQDGGQTFYKEMLSFHQNRPALQATPLLIAEKYMDQKVFTWSSLCPVFTSGSPYNWICTLIWGLDLETCSSCVYLNFISCCFCPYLFIQKELAEVDKYEVYFARFRYEHL